MCTKKYYMNAAKTEDVQSDWRKQKNTVAEEKKQYAENNMPKRHCQESHAKICQRSRTRSIVLL